MKVGSIYGECIKCKELTSHVSGQCKECRKRKCKGCGKTYQWTAQSSDECMLCKKRKKPKSHQHEGIFMYDQASGV